MKKHKASILVGLFFSMVLLLIAAVPSFQTFDVHQFGTNSVNNIAIRLNAWATNVNFFAVNDSFTNGAVTLWPVPNNVNSMAMNIYGRGTSSAAGIHFNNTNSGASADVGIWGSTFGPPYTGNFEIDLYNANLAGAYGPGLIISSTGPFAGILSVPLFWVDATNLNTHFNGYAANRFGNTNTYFDAVARAFRDLRTTYGLVHSGTGTIGITNHIVTGTNTLFTSELEFGSWIVNGANLWHVTTIASDTSCNVSEITSLTNAAATFTCFRPALSAADTTGFSSTSLGDNLLMYNAIGPTVIDMVNEENLIVYQNWQLNSRGVSWSVVDVTGNKTPLLITKGAGNNSELIDAAGKVGFTNGAAVAGTFDLPIGASTAGLVWTQTNTATGRGFWGAAGSGSITSVTAPVGFNVNTPGGPTVAITYSNTSGGTSTNIDFSVNIEHMRIVTSATAYQMTNEPAVGYATVTVVNNASGNVVTMTPSTGRTNYWLGGVNFSNLMDNAWSEYYIKFHSNANIISVQFYK